MVRYVTGRQKNTGRGLRALRSPRSHDLTKTEGQTLSAGWQLKNDRATPASVRYSIWQLGPLTKELAEGPLVNVPAGDTVNTFPAVTWVVAGVPGVLTLGLFIDEESPEALVASHEFTVTIE